MWLIFALILFGFVYDWLTTWWIFQGSARVPLVVFGVPAEDTLSNNDSPATVEAFPRDAGKYTRDACAPNHAPTTFFRPIKRDVPNLAAKLHDFLSALNETDQALFGIDETDTTSQQVIQQAFTAFPHLDVTLIPCRSGITPNPKVNKLIQLAPLAKHEHWIILDSEIENCATFLTSFRTEWAGSQFPVMSATYRFRKLTLNTLPVLTTLLPGLAVLQRTNKIRFTLGACMAVTRIQMAKLGGWEAFGNYLAEDYQLGHQAAQQNIPVTLSTAIAQLDNDAPASTSHQSPVTSHASALLKLHRVAVTYRVCNPWGFAGSLCNHTPFWCLLLIGQIPNHYVVALLILTFLSRILTISLRAQFIQWPISFSRLLLLSVPSAILETFFWFISWLPLPVNWGSRFWKVEKDGTLTQ